MKVGFLTLGCKVNQYETEALKEKFSRRGYEILGEGSDEPCDIYVINTCTVTNLAERKSRQFIRRAKKLNPDAIIGVTGCYAQIDPETIADIDGVDVVCGTNEKVNLPEYIERYVKEREASLHIKTYEELDSYCSDGIITAMESRTRAYIKIEEGCNRFCSYCIIPYARGRVRSRGEEEILAEARGLVDRGFKEIVLTGINTALYGSDINGSLKSLLLKIDEIPGDFRVRLSSLEPTVVGIGEVESILDSKRLCNHLHLSIQSGSDNVLRLMNRRYTGQENLEIVKMLRNRDPGFGITTDIIVGFPGETKEDFLDSVNMVKDAGFSKVHVFRYSPRKGTKAAMMEAQVLGEVKNSRAKELSLIADEAASVFLDSMIGNEERVLFEEKKGSSMVGYSDSYIRVYAPYKEEYINKFANVIHIEPHRDGMKSEIKD